MLSFLKDMFRPRPRQHARNAFECKNPLRMLHYRGGVLLQTYDFHNDITNVGKNHIFDVEFNGATQIANNNWWISIINASGYSTVAAGDTMASHGGWTEWTSYTQSTRVGWGSGTAAGQSITNAAPATFDMSAMGSLKGVFVVGNGSAKSGTSGTLWATALFGADVPVAVSDQIKITYTISA